MKNDNFRIARFYQYRARVFVALVGICMLAYFILQLLSLVK